MLLFYLKIRIFSPKIHYSKFLNYFNFTSIEDLLFRGQIVVCHKPSVKNGEMAKRVRYFLHEKKPSEENLQHTL